MGMNTVIPRTNSFINREEAHKVAKSAIHRARVKEVNPRNGTVSVEIEAISYRADGVTIPLLGLSAPPGVAAKVTAADGTLQQPDPGSTTADFSKSAWGRYMPQVGDLLYTGFDMNGTLYALGYASLFYPGFDKKDEEFESKGGIGWGATSGVDVQSGDWDFMSSRGSALYLGEKAKIGSRNCATTYNFFTGDIVTEAPLLRNAAGASEQRFGLVKRKVIPTDSEEKSMPSTRAGTSAQEFTTVVKWESLPSGLDLAGFSMGDVVEEVATRNIIKVSPLKLTTRRYFYSVSEVGVGTTYEESVDSGGNYYVDALLATQTQWTTPLSAWTITNLSTSITSTTTLSLTSSAAFSATSAAELSMTSVGSLSLIAPQILLGGTLAIEPLLRATSFNTALGIYLSVAAAAWAALAAEPLLIASASTSAAAGTAAGVFASALSGLTTTITKAA